MPPVLPLGRGADAGDVAPRQGRLQDVRGVERTLGRTGADQGVDLVDEDEHVLALLEFLEDALQALLELATVLRAGHDQGQVERDYPLAREELRRQPLGHPLRQPLDDRGLAHPRLPEQDRVILRPPREDLDDAPDLLLAADQRVELVLLRQRGQIAPELGQEGQFLLAPAAGALAGDGRDLFAHRRHLQPVLHEDALSQAAVDP